MTSKTSSMSKSKSISKKKGPVTSCGGSKSPETRSIGFKEQKKTRLETLMRTRKDSLIPDKKGKLFEVIRCQREFGCNRSASCCQKNPKRCQRASAVPQASKINLSGLVP